MKMTVQQITEFYQEYPECIGKLTTETRFGRKTVEYADITAFDSPIHTLTTETGKKVSTSPEHLLFNGSWLKTKDVHVGDTLHTIDGTETVVSHVIESYTDDLYDLQIEDVKEFYANGFVSHNSTILDAISFALFGKPHRNINKPQLVNSINQKGCVVEVEFQVNNNSFKVVRGIKPAKFEIWKNGTLINQNSHNKEYQKVLEQNILKLNHKSFHQVVVLGSSSFIPFMQLPSHHRREVIEDLLDINVFSKMNQLLKEKNAILKDQIKDNLHQIDINETKLDSQKKYIRDIKKINKDYRAEKEALIKEETKELFDLQEVNSRLIEEVSATEPKLNERMKKASDKMRKLNQYESDFNSQMRSVVKDAKFYEENESCPTCEQEIAPELKEEKVKESKDIARELDTALRKLIESQREAKGEQEQVESELEETREKQREIHANTQTISRLQGSIQAKQEELDFLNSESGDMAQAEKEFESLREERNSLTEKKFQLSDQQAYNQVMLELLKDTGIKTKIIKQYLPVINKLVNSYLQVLDFFVQFNLDEAFNESIRSRHRDSFSYDSFSEGEKMKIDLALLFTWRQVAKMKNSVSTNLLILDETFDSSLDQDGIENLMKILHTLDENTNVFVISHKTDILDGKFESKVEFVKHKNFSRIK